MFKPFLIGIAGGSGSGKTTVVANLTKFLHNQDVICISHDDYYRDQTSLPMRVRVKTNYDHPQALETTMLVTHLRQLIAGKTINKPTYDFSHHTRSQKTEKLLPAKIIIVEGILLFAEKALRDLFDLKVFVDTDADERVLRRIDRDLKERGRTFDFVVNQYLKFTKPMHEQFVEPSKRFADIVLPGGGHNTRALDLLLARVNELI